MKTGTFMDIIGVHYDDIKRIYSTRDNNNGKKFNEDAFNEAFIKCSIHFKNDLITYEDAIKYYWVAYVNTSKGDNKYLTTIDLCESYNDVEDEEEDSFSAKFYDDIMNAISKSFSENDMMIYSLYKYHKWSIQELIDAGYDCTNFKIRIKNIHRFVKEYAKKKYKKIKKSL